MFDYQEIGVIIFMRGWNNNEKIQSVVFQYSSYVEGLNPGEEKNIDVTIISNNNFDTFFKLYYKGNVIVTTKDRTMDKLESYKNKVITVNVKNDTSEYQTFKIDAKNGLNFGELELNDEENEI